MNTPTTLGSIGMTTGLDPALTLGCGGYGGNITSDNISPRHLLNVKRLAWEVTPAGAGAPSPPAGGISGAGPGRHLDRRPDAAAEPGAAPPVPARPVEFVCEADVRDAIRDGRTILIGRRTIVTPAARDLGAGVLVDEDMGKP